MFIQRPFGIEVPQLILCFLGGLSSWFRRLSAEHVGSSEHFPSHMLSETTHKYSAWQLRKKRENTGWQKIEQKSVENLNKALVVFFRKHTFYWLFFFNSNERRPRTNTVEITARLWKSKQRFNASGMLLFSQLFLIKQGEANFRWAWKGKVS